MHQEVSITTGKSIRITTVREKVAAREVLGTVNPKETMCTRTYSSFPGTGRHLTAMHEGV
jgi:hypothetical protein